MIELTDISVVSCREAGERRKSGVSYNKHPEAIVTEKWNPFKTAMNHRKHAGSIYRKAEGGFQKSQPRYHPDWFE